MRDENKYSGKNAATFMSNFVNGLMGDDAKIFVKELAADHRTLQANMVRLVISYLRAIAENGTDDRNEAAVKAAQIMVKAVDDAGASAIPYI